MTLFVAYLFGILGSTIFRWALWKTPDKPWVGYLKAEAGPVVASTVLALICYGLWAQGLLSTWAESIHQGLGVPVTWWTTIPAAALIDHFAIEAMGWLTSWVKARRGQE